MPGWSCTRGYNILMHPSLTTVQRNGHGFEVPFPLLIGTMVSLTFFTTESDLLTSCTTYSTKCLATMPWKQQSLLKNSWNPRDCTTLTLLHGGWPCGRLPRLAISLRRLMAFSISNHWRMSLCQKTQRKTKLKLDFKHQDNANKVKQNITKPPMH